MACFKAAGPVLTLLYRLTFSISQILRGRGSGNNNMLNFAIFCKMTYFVAIETFCKGKISFLSQNQCNYGLNLDCGTSFS